MLPLLARAAGCGLVGMLSLLLDMVPQESMQQVAAFRDAAGMGMLHLAVRSGNTSLIAVLLEACDTDIWQVSDLLDCSESVHKHCCFSCS